MKLTDEMLEKGVNKLRELYPAWDGFAKDEEEVLIELWEAMEVETPMEKWRRENREAINRRQRNRYYRGKPRPEEQ